MAIFTWPFPRNPSAPPLLGIMALAVAAAAAIMLAAGLVNIQGNPQAPTVQAQNVAADRAALTALYDATNGDSWTTNTNWNSNEPLGNWHGVTTNASGRVTNLRLFNNNLTGTLPASLGNLSELVLMVLYSNSLTGSIPPELGGLSNLTHLSIYGNNFTGSIPPELGDMSSLTDLYLYDNSLTGTVPPELSRLSRMTGLLIGGNQLTGQLPYSFTELSALEIIRFANNAGLCAPLDSDFQAWLDEMTTAEGDDCPRTRIRTATGAPVAGEPVIAELTAREDRLARIEATLADYTSNPCIGYDGLRRQNAWSWRRASVPTGPFAIVRDGRHPNATFVYLPQAADVGMYLVANITVDGNAYDTDPIGPVAAAHGVGSGDQVSVAAPTGALTVGNDLSVSLPDAAAAERGNPAINPRLEPWQWERSDDGSTGWTNVTPYHKHCDTPDAQYPLTTEDDGKHLRSYIYYNDDSSGSAVLKRAEAASVGPVAP